MHVAAGRQPDADRGNPGRNRHVGVGARRVETRFQTKRASVPAAIFTIGLSTDTTPAGRSPIDSAAYSIASPRLLRSTSRVTRSLSRRNADSSIDRRSSRQDASGAIVLTETPPSNHADVQRRLRRPGQRDRIELRDQLGQSLDRVWAPEVAPRVPPGPLTVMRNRRLPTATCVTRPRLWPSRATTAPISAGTP